VGTALLVAVGLSIVIAIFGRDGPIATLVPSAAWRRAIAGAGFGTVGALIAISPLGRLSGAHINPAVSLAFWLEGKLAWRDLLGYMLAQMLGAVAGAVGLLLWGMTGRELGFGATGLARVPGRGLCDLRPGAGNLYHRFTRSYPRLHALDHSAAVCLARMVGGTAIRRQRQSRAQLWSGADQRSMG
jgi:hypothetical protein